jgi:CTP:phosphocholine cytidylyltransferase-like protein
MNIIILGDKYEKGMKSKGCQATIAYSKRISMIEHQRRYLVKALKKFNLAYVYGLDAKTFIGLDTKFDHIEKIYNDRFGESNYAYSLYCAKHFLNNHCLIIFGDTAFNSVCLKDINLDTSTVFVDNKSSSDLGCVVSENVVTNITFDLPIKINDKIFFLTKNDAIKVKEILENPQNHNNFVFELMNKIIDTGSTITTQKRIK